MTTDDNDDGIFLLIPANPKGFRHKHASNKGTIKSALVFDNDKGIYRFLVIFWPG